MPGFSTRALHAGQEPDPATGAVVVPIYQTSTFAQEAVGKHRGYEYSRTGNPTRAALEQCIASLEGGAHGLAFASGMAAEAAIMQLLKPNDHTVAVDDLYGGTYRLFRRILEPMGLSFTFVITSEEEQRYKPAPSIFQRAIRYLGLPAENILHVGDSFEEDVVGASAVGMGSLLIQRSGRSKDPVPKGTKVVRNLGEVRDFVRRSWE